MTWAELNLRERHQLMWPDEHVMRFLAGVEPGRLLDIGAGVGRHMNAATKLGFKVEGVDFGSPVPEIVQAVMTDLPFEDDSFDVALAVGVFYYGTRQEHQQAIGEMHRILKDGGRGFVVIRRDDDWRSYDIPPDEPEHGMEMDFVDGDELKKLYGGFSDLNFEMSAWTSHRRQRWNSDWLITVTK